MGEKTKGSGIVRVTKPDYRGRGSFAGYWDGTGVYTTVVDQTLPNGTSIRSIGVFDNKTGARLSGVDIVQNGNQRRHFKVNRPTTASN